MFFPAYVSIGYSASVATTTSRSLLTSKSSIQSINNSMNLINEYNNNSDNKDKDKEKNNKNIILTKEKKSDASLLNFGNNNENKNNNSTKSKNDNIGIFEEISTIKIKNIIEINENENLKTEKRSSDNQVFKNLGGNINSQKNNIQLIPFLRNDFGIFTAQQLPPPLLLNQILVREINILIFCYVLYINNIQF